MKKIVDLHKIHKKEHKNLMQNKNGNKKTTINMALLEIESKIDSKKH